MYVIWHHNVMVYRNYGILDWYLLYPLSRNNTRLQWDGKPVPYNITK